MNVGDLVLVAVVAGGLGGAGYVADVPGLVAGDNVDVNNSAQFDLILDKAGGDSLSVRLVDGNGSSISGADILVNGDQLGQTDESGEVSFNVPENSQNITVSATSSGSVISKTFRVEDEDSNEDIGDSLISLVSPDDKVTETDFEAEIDLRASDASYRIYLDSDEKASGQIDGSKTVYPQLSIPEGETGVLVVQIIKNSRVDTSRSFSLTHTSQSLDSGDSDGSSGSGDENADDQDSSDGQEVSDNDSEDDVAQAEVSARLGSVGASNPGEVVSFDASRSQGQITSYNWKFGDGSQESTGNAFVDHTYSQTGQYDLNLTVIGEQGARDSEITTVNVEEQRDPSISLNEPADGAEINSGFMDYSFDVSDAGDDASYSIMIDGQAADTGELVRGSSSIDRSVSVPEESFNTWVVVQQDGETFSTDQRTIEVQDSDQNNEAEFYLNGPYDGEKVTSQVSPAEVYIEYEVVENGSYTDGQIQIENSSGIVVNQDLSIEEGLNSRPVSLGEGSYTGTLRLSGDGAVSKSNEFEVVYGEPNNEVNLIEPEDEVEVQVSNSSYTQQTVFSIDYKSGVNGDLFFEIIAVESAEAGSGDDTKESDSEEEDSDSEEEDSDSEEEVSGETEPEYDAGEQVVNKSISVLEGMNQTQDLSYTFYASTQYKWRAWLTTEEGEEVKSSEFRSINVTG